MNFRLKQRPPGSWDSVTLEVIIRTDGESSIVALGQKSWRKIQRSPCQSDATHTNPTHYSRSAGHAESGVRIVKEKVRALVCFARDLHGGQEITCFTPVLHEICSSNTQQISSWNRWSDRPSQSLWSLKSPTMSLGRKRCFTWTSPRERSESKRHDTRGFSLEIKDGGGHATRNCFCEEHPQSSKRGFWRWYAVQQYPRSPMGLAV